MTVLCNFTRYYETWQDDIRLTAVSFLSLQTFAGPLGQQPIFGWPSGPATDHVRSVAAHNLLWPMATTS